MKSFISTKRQVLLMLLAVSGSIFTSCKKDEMKPILPYDITRGVAISNEGNFGSGNASLSVYYPDGDSIENDVFYKVNNRVLGDVFQSIGFAGDYAYLVINFSNKIEVVNKTTCAEVTTITGVESPRYFLAINNQKAYVTLWGGSGKVGVIDVVSNTLTKQISVGAGPEKMVYINEKVYVTDCGGYGNDNKVTVINAQTDEVFTTITVGDNPKDIVIDKNNKIWVLCSGVMPWGNNLESSSKLMMINPNSNIIEKTIDLGSTFHPAHLEINQAKDMLYYGGDYGVAGIFSLSISAIEKAASPLINDYFYAFNIDPNNGIIYAFQAPYTSSGSLLRYTPSGDLLGAVSLGALPNGGYFAD